MSIDTIQIDSYVKIQEDNKALHEEPKNNLKTGMYKYIMNINNLSEDGKQIYNYCDYIKYKSDLIVSTDLNDANTVRVDFAFDSFTDGYYKDMFVVTKYLLMLIANKYKVKNVYECVNQWTLEKNSMNLKGQYFDVENYNKEEQENKSENETDIKDRLEFRMKKLYDDAEERKEITAFTKLKTILNKSISEENINELNDKMIELLIKKIAENEDTNKIDETLTVYKDNIFNRYILENVYAAFGYKNAKRKAYRFIQKKKLMMYSENDMKMFVNELIEQGQNYFENGQELSQTE